MNYVALGVKCENSGHIIMIDRTEIDLSGKDTVKEREAYCKRIAAELYEGCDCSAIDQEPVFFVVLESKMNDENFFIED